MEKLDIPTARQILLERHTREYEDTRRCVYEEIRRGKSDREVYESVRDIAARANLVLSIARDDFGVELGRGRITEDVVRSWRINCPLQLTHFRARMRR